MKLSLLSIALLGAVVATDFIDDVVVDDRISWTQCNLVPFQDAFQCGMNLKPTGQHECCAMDIFGKFCVMRKDACLPTDECSWWRVDCKLEDLKEKFDDFSEDLEEEWEALEVAIKEKFENATTFAQLKVEELKKIGHEVIAKAKACAGMTVDQLKGLMDELKEFSAEQLKMLLEHIDAKVMKDAEALKEFGNKVWSEIQSSVIVSKLKDVLGEVEKWSAETLQNMKQLLARLSVEDLKKIAVETFMKAKQAFEAVETWTKEQAEVILEKLQEWAKAVQDGAQTIQELAEDKFQEVSKLVQKIREAKVTVNLSLDQLEVLITVNGTTVVDLDSDEVAKQINMAKNATLKWTKEQLNKVAKLLPALTLEKLKEFLQGLNSERIEGLINDALESLGKALWEKAQATEIVQVLKSELGDIKEWTEEQIKEFKNLLCGLNATDIENFTKKQFKVILDDLNQVLTQADENVQKVVEFTEEQLLALKKKAVDTLGEATDWTEEEVQKLAALISKLAEKAKKDYEKLVEKLSPEAVVGAMKQLGKQVWDKVSASQLWQKIKKTKAEVWKWVEENVESFKGLVAGINATDIAEIPEQVFKQLLKTIGEIVDWSEKEVQVIIAKAQEVIGSFEEWTAEQFDELKELIAKIEAVDLKKLSKDVLVKAKEVTRLVADQLVELAEQVSNMTVSQLRAFYKKVAGDQFKQAWTDLVKASEWSKNRVEVLFEKLTEANVFGNFSDWTSDTFKELGDLLGPLVFEGKIDQINEVAMRDVYDLIVRGVVLSDEFETALDEWKIETIEELAQQIMKAIPVKNWTAEIIAKVDVAIAGLKNLTDIPKEKFVKALDDLANNHNWIAIKNMTAKLVDKIIEAKGDVHTWVNDELKELKELLPVVLTPENIQQLTEKAIDKGMEMLVQIANAGKLTKEQVKLMFERLVQVYGNVTTWSKEQIQKIGSLIAGFDIEDLKSLADEAVAILDPLQIRTLNFTQIAEMSLDKIRQLTQEAKDQITGSKLANLLPEIKQYILGLKNCTKSLVEGVDDDAKNYCPKAVVDFKVAFEKAIDKADEQRKQLERNVQKVVENVAGVVNATVEIIDDALNNVVGKINKTFSYTLRIKFDKEIQANNATVGLSVYFGPKQGPAASVSTESYIIYPEYAQLNVANVNNTEPVVPVDPEVPTNSNDDSTDASTDSTDSTDAPSASTDTDASTDSTDSTDVSTDSTDVSTDSNDDSTDETNVSHAEYLAVKSFAMVTTAVVAVVLMV